MTDELMKEFHANNEAMKQALDYEDHRRGIQTISGIKTFYDPPRFAYKVEPKPCAWCGGLPPRCCHSSIW